MFVGVRNYLYYSMHMFLAKLTDVRHKQCGATVLYVPREVQDITAEDAIQDRELIKRLEAIVVYWTKQIRVGIQEQSQSSSTDLRTIMDEYEAWKFRCKTSNQLIV